MGKGQARRRRLVNALKAKTEKQGKAFVGGASSGVKKRKEQAREDVPSSFRKMLMLKAAAEGRGGSRPKHQGQQRPAGGARPEARPKQQRQQPAAEAAAGETQKADSSQAAAEASASHDAPIAEQPGQQPPRQPRQEQHQPEPTAAKPVQQLQQARKAQQQQQQQQGGSSGSRFGAFKKKSLRADKKEFLKLKKLRKKGALAGGEGGLVEKERELLAKESSSRPQFGEQAAAPINANLKRRHWVEQERSAAERCKQVFLEQMQRAQAAAAAGVGEGGAERVRAGGQQPRQQQQQQQQPGGSSSVGKTAAKAEGKGKAKQAGGRPGKQPGAAGVDEAARLQLIEAYREAKRQKLEAAGRGLGTTATPQSLAALVRRDAGKAAASDA